MNTISIRLYPPRKTEAERQATHEAIYGAGTILPPRQYRFSQSTGLRTTGLQTNSSALLLLLGAGLLLLFLGKK